MMKEFKPGDRVNVAELRAARANGERPVAPRADLGGADLRSADLWRADLGGADLRSADLRGADLCGADLRGGDLRGADLGGADLRGADLWGADLWGANLGGADLGGADLRGADLWGADLWGGFQHNGLPSGQAVGFPTPDGWILHIGCWTGTTAGLRELVAGANWPSNCGPEEQERRRPGLLLLADLFDAHCVYHAHKLADVVERWGTKSEAVTE